MPKVPSKVASKLRMSCAALSLLAAMPAMMQHALAQQTEQLRGQVPESSINDELLRRQKTSADGKLTGRKPTATTEETTDAPAYEPLSAGAVADEDAARNASASDSLFDPDADNSASDDLDAEPLQRGRTPSTAKRRTEEARDRLTPNRKKQDTSTSRQRPSEVDKTGTKPTTDDDLTTAGVERVGKVDGDVKLRTDRDSERENAIEGLDKKTDENPYAPVGLRLGTFNVYSTLEQGLTWTSNVNQTPVPQSGLLSETTGRIRAESDWAQHQATVEAYGTLRRAIDGPDPDDDEFGLDATTRLDISEELRGLGTFRYQHRPESASSPVVIEDAVTRPLRQTLEGTGGIEKDMGKLRLSAIGGLEYNDYGDATLVSGSILSQKERNSLLGTLKLRTGYEISPALTPFVELELGRRAYEQEIDSAGYRRSANRLGVRGGMEVDLNEKLRGEIAVGWLNERPDDERLADVSGASVDGNLVWSPERGTNISLYGSTTVEGTTTPGESGSLLYTSRLSIDRQIRANLTGTALLGAAWRDYIGSDGHDLTLTAEAGLTWWLNRSVGVTTRARHERVRSNLVGRDTETSSAFLGLKLQR